MFRKTLNVFNAMTANKNKNNRQISNAVSDQKNTEDKYRSTFTFGFGVGSKVQNKTQK